LAGPRLALLVATSTAVFSLSSAVEAAQPERPCPFASGEASGSERLCLPPKVGPQPMHPVRQYTAWHREVCGDVAVVPAVYNPALQQYAVVISQIQE
jgi:hypothetical protein